MNVILVLYFLVSAIYIPIYLYKNRVTYFVEGMSWPPLKPIAGMYIGGFKGLFWPYFLIKYIINNNKLKKKLELSNAIKDSYNVSKKETADNIKISEEKQKAKEEFFNNALPKIKELEKEIEKLDHIKIIDDPYRRRDNLDKNAINFLYSKDELMIKFHTEDRYGHENDASLCVSRDVRNDRLAWVVHNSLSGVEDELGKSYLTSGSLEFNKIENAIKYMGKILGKEIGKFKVRGF